MNASSCFDYFHFESAVTLAVLNGLSSAIAVFGNIIVLMAVHRKHYLQTPSNFFLCSLATADLSIGLIMNPLNIAMNVETAWVKFDHVLQKLQSFFWIQMTTATTFSLCSVTLDRYLAITTHFRYKSIVTTRRCIAAIFFNWAFSLLFASLSFYVPAHNMTKVWIACAFITVVIPLTIISFCYFRICALAAMHNRRIANENSNDEIGPPNAIPRSDSAGATRRRREIIRSRRNTKAAWTAGVIILVFAITFLPSFVVNCLQILNTDLCRMHYYQSIWAWASFISYISAATDPWIYAIRSEEYRAAFKSIFKMTSRQDNDARFAATSYWAKNTESQAQANNGQNAKTQVTLQNIKHI